MLSSWYMLFVATCLAHSPLRPPCSPRLSGSLPHPHSELLFLCFSATSVAPRLNPAIRHQPPPIPTSLNPLIPQSLNPCLQSCMNAPAPSLQLEAYRFSPHLSPRRHEGKPYSPGRSRSWRRRTSVTACSLRRATCFALTPSGAALCVLVPLWLVKYAG